MANGLDLRFFASARLNFATALKRGEIQFYLRLVEFTVCLRFAGPVMVEALTAALKHLQIEPVDRSDLTICIWDNASTGSPPLALPWAKETQAFRGEVEDYSSAQIQTVVDIHTKALNALDHIGRVALYWIRDYRDLPWWVGGSPLQLILHWWMRARGYQLTHVAAVGDAEGAVLLAGKSGSGKSTTALACMKYGMKYIGEDYCFLSDLPKIWAYSVYNSSKIEEQTLRWFPELQKHVVNSNRNMQDKAFIFHHQFQPEKLLRGCPIKAVLSLHIEPTKESWLEPIDVKEATTALSISTMWQLTHTGPLTFKHLQRIAMNLPCYRLHLGSDLTQTPKLIEKLL